MKITNIEVYGLESAMRGCRNPKNSWGKSDSVEDYTTCVLDGDDKNWNMENFILRQADMKLSQQLTRAGGEHCKHLRMIQVWFDMTAPRYMWQEFDCYKHVEKISCSTMHKLFERELTLDDFEGGSEFGHHLIGTVIKLDTIRLLHEEARLNKDTESMTELLIQAKTILPESFLQKRTVNINYQQLLNIYIQRKHHRLPVWKEFCKMVEGLPYFVELTGLEVKGDVE